ncbi:MAG TPA: hypothetical protein VF823_00865 [Anaerolineales bacterium]
MKIVTNDQLIRRNARIAQFSMLAGLLVLAGGMFISFRVPQYYALSLAALLLGFVLSQIGIYFSNRWGRSPRPDQLLNQALKGLDAKFTLYHYKTPVSHLLVGPSGVWVLLPRQQQGLITYSKDRWHQKGGNLYMKIFGQESLGRPDLEVNGEVESVRDFLTKRLPAESKIPEVQAALVFTNPKASIQVNEAESAPAETVMLGKLKDLVRKPAKGKSLSVERIRQVQNAFGDGKAVVVETPAEEEEE